MLPSPNGSSSNMAFPQMTATFLALFDAISLPGNLLVIATIISPKDFYVMRYILLASLAVSDLLFLILVNSFRIASIAQESWLYGDTMCFLSPLFQRYFYINTVLRLMAVSYNRYEDSCVELVWSGREFRAVSSLFSFGEKSLDNGPMTCKKNKRGDRGSTE